MSDFTQENMYKALGLFIEAMRGYIISVLQKEAKDNWQAWYYESLTPPQQSGWELGIKNGTAPQNLIDYPNLKGFSLKYKSLLYDDFGKNTNKLPTWLEEIAEVRNKCQHFQQLDKEEIQRAYGNMILIAKQLGMQEMEEELTALRDQKQSVKPEQSRKQKGATSYSGIIPWFKNVTPHMDIRQGLLDESIFAANLTEVALGNGREIYQNPAMFFSKTFFTSGLKTVAARVIKGLNGRQDAENRVMSLQTGFGGGKTHTLIALYHIVKLAKKAAEHAFSKDLIDFTGIPKFDSANIAVFTNNTNDPVQGREVNGAHIRTLWGELAWQLGGKEAYELIRANDENRTAPKGLFKKVLKKTKPALILIDELADYCVAASGITVGDSSLSDQTISFIQELSEAIATTDHCVLVATLPASTAEVANSEHASQILNSLSNRLGRVGADTKPVADEEIFEVIRRRLFEDLGDDELREQALSEYLAMYQKLLGEVPSHSVHSEYREKLRKSYPFHPELIDMFRIRWAANHDFQRTRGVLRLLASIVADLWKRQGSLTGTNALIHTSDVHFENLDALCGQLKKLYGNGYDAVLSADIAGTSSNAFKIDDEKKEYGPYQLTQGIAATILLGSFGSTSANKGISIEEIKLCMLKPDTFNHNMVNSALDLMEGRAHYLYSSSIGTRTKRYWFHTKPNINILVAQAKNEIEKTDIHAEILQRLNAKSGGITFFNVLINPPADIPEQKKPTLVVLGPKYTANPDQVNHNARPVIERIATKKGNGERIYRNTLLFLLCSEVGYTRLESDLREYLSCIRIRDEYQGQLEADQKADIRSRMDEFSQKADRSLVAAYSILVKHSAKSGLEKVLIKQFKEKFDLQVNATIYQLLKDEEWMLESIGVGTLKRNNLFPTVEQPVRAKDVYEAFIRYDDKPMIRGIDAVISSLERYCYNGEFAIAYGDGQTFSNMFYKEKPSFFDIEDSGYWLVDKSLYKQSRTDKDDKSDNIAKNGREDYGDDAVISEAAETEDKPRLFKSVTISGRVSVENYNQVFSSFVLPLSKNQVEIEIRIRGKSTESNPITENSQQYKITKESASQLGLGFEVEE